MKDKMIKNIGIMVGTSNLAFASATSGGIKDEKLEEKEEFKGIVNVLKNYTNQGVDSTQLTKDIFSKFYKCTKTENKKSKINILNYSLNFGIKKDDVKDFFKGKIKIAKGKKNVIVLKKNPIIVPLQNTEEEILKSYKSLLEEECIILELDQDGSVKEFYNTNVDTDKDTLKKLTGDDFDIKKIYEKALAKNTKNSDVTQITNIIKVLNNKNLGFGIHEINDNSLDSLDGYFVLQMQDAKELKALTSTIIPKGIEVKIKTNISSITLSGLNNEKLKKEDIIICKSNINSKKKLLIAKAEDVSKGKIENKVIDSEFYKSSLEEFFKTVNQIKDEDNHFKPLINIFINDKYDCGQYNLGEATIKNFRSLMSKDIDLNSKDLEWICLRNNETSGGSINKDVFKKDIDFSGAPAKAVTSNGMKSDCWIKANDIIIAVESNKNLLLIAKGSDISTGTVNGQTIDNNFYVKPAK